MRHTIVCVLIVVSALCEVYGATIEVINGAPWYDTSGNRLECHGGGMLLVGKTYYWYGENGKGLPSEQHGINCYSSTDLLNWKFEREIFKQTDVTDAGAPGPYIVERPKVLYNKKTAKYVLWFHLDNNGYVLRSVGVAVSDTPNGEFKWVRGFKPDGLGSLDQSVYQDDNGIDAYHVRSVENQYVGISRLSDDYLNTTGVMISKISESREAPAIFKYNDKYFMVTSHLTGWAPNEMDMFVTGSSLDGANWVSLGNPTHDATTYDTQSADVLIYKDMIIYQGDKWNEAGPGGLANATYVWLPFVIKGDTITLPYVPAFKLPV